MFVLHVSIDMKTGREEAARAVFAGPFSAAISAQPGFQGVRFLKPVDGGAHVLAIAFESQQLQQKWVATALHAEVWPQMEAHFEAYTVTTYNTL